MTPPLGTPKYPLFCSRQAVCPVTPLLYGWRAGSAKYLAHTRQQPSPLACLLARLIQIPFNCPKAVYRWNGPISDLNNHPRRRLFVSSHSGACMGHVECRTRIRIPSLSAISTSWSYRCCHQSHLGIHWHIHFGQYHTLLGSSPLTVTRPVLKTFS